LAKRTEAKIAFGFLAPFLAVWFILLIVPVFRGAWISLHDWEIVGSHRYFIGLQNYVDLWADPVFWQAIWNTTVFVAITVPSVTIVALLLALALNKPGRFYSVLRSMFFATSVLSVTVVTLVWTMVLRAENGLINNMFESLGLPQVGFLSTEGLAMVSLSVATVWWVIGFPLMLFLAGLQQIPKDIYEAAKLDDSGFFRTLYYITLPGLRRMMAFVVITQTISHFQLFGQSVLMTQGGPAGSTRSIVQFIYEMGFQSWQLGYASAASMVLLGVMFVASLIQFLMSTKGETA